MGFTEEKLVFSEEILKSQSISCRLFESLKKFCAAAKSLISGVETQLEKRREGSDYHQLPLAAFTGRKQVLLMRGRWIRHTFDCFQGFDHLRFYFAVQQFRGT